MDSHEPGSSAAPLELRCKAVAPWLWTVAWNADGERTSDDEREQIAQIAVSRANGAFVVLAPDGAIGSKLPDALTPIAGPHGAAIVIEQLPAAAECGAVAIFAPRGRGRVLMATQAPLDESNHQLIRALSSKTAIAQARGVIDEVLAAIASECAVPPLPRLRPSLDKEGFISAATDVPGSPGAADGIERFLEPGERPVVARLVRESESFTLRPTVHGRPLSREQLVLVRATAPADRGALLRVFLDDEDLGAWRLGDGQTRERVSLDLFRISSDLLAGRADVRLTFKLEAPREIASLRWWFLHEEEPDGLWLTELEATRSTTTAAQTASVDAPLPKADRAADGGLLVHGEQLFLRGLELVAGSRVSYALPRGERRLVATIATRATGAPVSVGATLVVKANGATTRVAFAAGDSTRRELSLPLSTQTADGELELAVEGGAPLLLLAPKLLR